MANIFRINLDLLIETFLTVKLKKCW